ncbi:MAG: hydroxymethylbilane synthase [Pseudomonadota bacterium]
MKITIATRRSPLALWQANHVAALLRQHESVDAVELLELVTKGDRILDQSLSKIGGKGLFIKELEHAMLEGKADIAVHSMKDVPAQLPTGFALPTVLQREDPRDALVGLSLAGLPDGARVGTSSLRRQAQLLALRPDLKIAPVRGNVGTRLSKLESGEFDAIMLATAGLNRLELQARIAESIDPALMLPAAGQGIVGIECKADQPELLKVLNVLDNSISRQCVEAERAISQGLGADCHAPVAAFAEVSDNELHLRARVASADGQIRLHVEGRTSVGNRVALASELIAELRELGARELIDASAQ